MTINAQSQYIISHPCFKEAVRQYNLGNTKEFEILLTDIQFHCIDTQIKNSAKEYGSCKRMLTSDIKKKLAEIEPPTNLNILLHIPKVELEPICKIVNISEAPSIKKRVVRLFNPFQLSFSFPELFSVAY